MCGLDHLSPGGVAYITSPTGLTSVPIPSGVSSSATVSLQGASDNVAIIAPPEVQSPKHHLIFSKDPLSLHVQVTLFFNPALVPSLRPYAMFAAKSGPGDITPEIEITITATANSASCIISI